MSLSRHIILLLNTNVEIFKPVHKPRQATTNSVESEILISTRKFGNGRRLPFTSRIAIKFRDGCGQAEVTAVAPRYVHRGATAVQPQSSRGEPRFLLGYFWAVLYVHLHYLLS